MTSTSRGRTYQTSSHSETVQIFVRRTPPGESPVTVYDGLKQRYDRDEPQYTLNDRDVPHTGVVALSGFLDDHARAFYVRVVVGPTYSYYLWWRYPGSTQPLADQEISHMARTFRPTSTQR